MENDEWVKGYRFGRIKSDESMQIATLFWICVVPYVLNLTNRNPLEHRCFPLAKPFNQSGICIK